MTKLVVALSLGTVLLSSNAAHSKLLTSDEIAALLPTIVAIGEQTRQIFSAAGPTTYTDRGRDTFGNWRVQDDQYCSQWPPSDLWACYALERSGEKLRFVGKSIASGVEATRSRTRLVQHDIRTHKNIGRQAQYPAPQRFENR